MAAPQYFAGQIQLGTLTQTADAFAQVQQSLSWFVDTYPRLAAWKAVVDRLTTFGEAMAKAKAAQRDSGFQAQPQDSPRCRWLACRWSCRTGRALLEDVNVTVRQGESTVVRGPSGSGKTTLFRVLAGLWPFGRGRIATPRDARVLFLPQKPYLPIGTLKDALCYPDCARPAHRRGMHARCSTLAGSGISAPRLAEATNWSLVLSGGEQQRIAFARALLYRPEWLFLDEATSALDEAAERKMYDLLKQRLPATTLISVAHRQTVAAFHDRQLVIDPASHRVLSQPVTG